MALPAGRTAAVDASRIADNVRRVQARIAGAAHAAGRDPSEITLVAVSKTFTAEHIRAAHAAGLRDFGENWVQEAGEKIPLLADLDPRPIWHMIGHLQSNKVKAVLGLFDIIHGVDSVRLAQNIAGRVTEGRFSVLLEVNAARESSKFGFDPEAVAAAAETIRSLPGLDLAGLMTVASLSADPEEARAVFRQLRELRDRLGLRHLSMGMTDDFEVAIQEGATMVRIGRAIFGERT